MIDPKTEIFKWGPIDGRPIYIDPFVQAFMKFPRFVDGSWPDSIGFFRDDKIFFAMDYNRLRDNGEHLFNKYILDDKELKKGYKIWLRTANNVKRFEKLVNKGLSKLSDAQLAKQLVAWNKDHVEFWIYGFLPELSNWGAEQMLRRDLLKLYPKNFIEIFEKLCAPEDISFFQKEEIDFFKIKLTKGSKKQEDMLKAHQKKYYWLRNNYGFTKVLDIDYFREELGRISPENAAKKIKDIKSHLKQVKEEKKRIIKEFKIRKDIAKIAHRLAYCVWWQDYRKSFIFTANHIISSFLRELSKRKGIDFKELCYYTTPEIDALALKNKRVDVAERFIGFIEYSHEFGKPTFMQGKETVDFMRPYIRTEVKGDVKEIKGIVVSIGPIVRGKVRVLMDLKNIEKMQKGDILVAPMTSPDYIVAMRKASAIITDEGNMTCHAAIVSRELKVPCIVQTRIATKRLKDGDLVEVDTKRGIVKIMR